MSTFTELQSAINRFSNDPAGFETIAVDGLIGNDTFGATLITLDIIRSGCLDFSNCPRPALAQFSADADALWNAINGPDDVVNNAPTLLALILNSADALGYGAVAAPAPTAATVAKKPPAPRGIILPVTQRKISSATSLFGLGLPDWIVYTGGGALALGLIATIASALKKRKRVYRSR